MPTLFISYRRADNEGHAVIRIVEWLERHFGEGSVVIDVDIDVGVDFGRRIRETVNRADVVLAVVGTAWWGLDESGHARLNDPDDWVRVEIETALARNVPIIPVLIGKANMPSAKELPSAMRGFATLNATILTSGRDAQWHMKRLVDAVDHRLIRRAEETASQAKGAAIVDGRRPGAWSSPGVDLVPTAKPARQHDVALAAADAHARNGECKAAVAFAADALEAALDSGDVQSELNALLLIAPARATLGDLEGARDSLVRLERLAADHPSRLFQIELLGARAWVQEAAGDTASAADSAREALDLAREHALSHEIAAYAHHVGSLLLRMGNEKGAVEALSLSYHTAVEHGFERMRWRNLCLLGFLAALDRGSDLGYTRMSQAVQYAEERHYVLELITEKYLLAIIAQRREQQDHARQLLHAVVELADLHGHARPCEDAEAGLRALEVGTSIALPR